MLEENKPITLELGTPAEAPTVPAAIAIPGDAAETVPTIVLTEEETQMVADFASKIDLQDSALVLQYGAACQKKIAAFSDSALEGIRTKDLGQTGEMITDLVTKLRGFSAVEEERRGFLGLFKKAGDRAVQLKAKYDEAEVNIDRIVTELEGHQNRLLTDIVMLDKLYDANLSYFKELSMYIIAGKRKLEEVRGGELAELMAKAQASSLQEDAQAANDLANLCDRFEKKIYDLELTRMISIQMAPQIRLIQNNNAVMSDKIQSTIVNTIPLWKSQMVLALGVEHSRQAAAAQRQVTDMTNELLKRNSETLKLATIDTAKESERGVVDMETLKQTNENLISTLDEVLRIQDEGRQKRREAEAELAQIEGQLKNKLLEIRR